MSPPPNRSTGRYRSSPRIVGHHVGQVRVPGELCLDHQLRRVRAFPAVELPVAATRLREGKADQTVARHEPGNIRGYPGVVGNWARLAHRATDGWGIGSGDGFLIP